MCINNKFKIWTKSDIVGQNRTKNFNAYKNASYPKTPVNSSTFIFGSILIY
jgi:hypothetical protein